jgi:hypothetical protein
LLYGLADSFLFLKLKVAEVLGVPANRIVVKVKRMGGGNSLIHYQSSIFAFICIFFVLLKWANYNSRIESESSIKCIWENNLKWLFLFFELILVG